VGSRRRPGEDRGRPLKGGGTLAYFSSSDTTIQEGRAVAAGGQVYAAKQSIGQYGFISLLIDTEGNLIGVHSMV
jgi:uncharacterized protein